MWHMACGLLLLIVCYYSVFRWIKDELNLLFVCICVCGTDHLTCLCSCVSNYLLFWNVQQMLYVKWKFSLSIYTCILRFSNITTASKIDNNNRINNDVCIHVTLSSGIILIILFIYIFVHVNKLLIKSYIIVW